MHFLNDSKKSRLKDAKDGNLKKIANKLNQNCTKYSLLILHKGCSNFAVATRSYLHINSALKNVGFLTF